MLSKEYAQPLHIEPRWHWKTATFPGAVYLLAFIAIAGSGASLYIILASGFLLAVSAWWTLKTYGLRTLPGAVTRMVWGPEREWRLWTADGREYHAELTGKTILHRACVVICLTCERRSWRVPVTQSMVSAETFRRLRVRILLTRKQSSN